MDKFKRPASEKRQVQCKYCGSIEVVRFGTYLWVQRYFCKPCKRKFISNDALPKMKTPIVQIAFALDCYYNGMSLNTIKRQLGKRFDNPVTDGGIYNWITRFAVQAAEISNKHIPSVGEVWIADEKNLKIGEKETWLWEIMDVKTRFLITFIIIRKRSIKGALTLLKNAVARTGKVPALVLTDKLRCYFDNISGPPGGIELKFLPSKGFQKPTNVNYIECLCKGLEERVQFLRKIKKVYRAKLLLDGWLVYYNFFRPHEALKNLTPAEKAGILSPYNGWGDLIRGYQSPHITGSPIKTPRS